MTLKAPDRPSVLAAVKDLKNKSNTLAFRYLWPADRDDQDDAWAGLLGCCWRAKGNLYIVPAEESRSVLVETRQFIENELTDYLSRFDRMAKHKIAAMAVAGEFRYIARVIRNRMVDHVRKVYRETPKPERTVAYEPGIQEQAPLIASVRAAEGRIAEELGRGPYEALWAVVEAWPVGKNLRQRKGKVTRAIMSARNVSHQQATKDRTNLLRLIADSHDPFLIGLRTSAWFRYVFNLTPEPRLRLDEFPANRFISEVQRNDQAPRPHHNPERQPPNHKGPLCLKRKTP